MDEQYSAVLQQLTERLSALSSSELLRLATYANVYNETERVDFRSCPDGKKAAVLSEAIMKRSEFTCPSRPLEMAENLLDTLNNYPQTIFPANVSQGDDKGFSR